jgi:HD-like signal output (HDOD) protein/nitrogen-specific signal transduction histidine kinase
MTGLSISNAARIDVGQLPSIPRVLLKLIEASHKVDVSFKELAGVIQQDPALSAKVIAIANSPYYAQWNDVRDFNRLLVVLGLNTIKTIAITSAVHQFFSQFDTELGKWMGTFWSHSLTCAYAAKALANLTSYDPPDEAYLAGLLHKIGQLVLLKKKPTDYQDILLNPPLVTEIDAREREMFGATSTEVGAYLIRKWDPDSFLSDAVLYQHEPADAVLDTPRLVKLINFAHKLSEMYEPMESLCAEAELLFGLSQPVIEDMLEGVRSDVKRAADSLGIQFPAEGDGTFDADTEEERLELAKKVRDFALLNGAQQHLSSSEQLERALVAILQDLKILFGLSRTLVFLSEPDGKHLQAVTGSSTHFGQIEEFRIPIKPGRSLVTESLISRSSLSTFDATRAPMASVLDSQLSMHLETEGIFCLPLCHPEQDGGVIVAGLDAVGYQALDRHRDLLQMFSGTAAATVYKCRALMEDRQHILDEERERRHGEASRLAHEANNPLAVIKNYLQVLSMRLADDQAVQEQVAILSEEIERVANIVLRMRDATDTGEKLQGTVDINQLIQDLMGIFRVSHFATHDIRDELILDDNLPPIATNRNSLKQVLTNLIRNALESLPKKGVVSIRTGDQVNVNGRQYVELVIADNGPGIPEEVMENIFNPVTSSKGREHAGLGLTIVRNLVSGLSGTISCRNKPEGGAEFTILLPRKTGQ